MSNQNRVNRPLVGPFSAKHLVVLAVALVSVAMLLSLLRVPLDAPRPTEGLPAPNATFVVTGEETEGFQIGDLAPELEGTINGQTVGLVDLDGQPIRLADLRGRPVWVNFWATWCPPCQEETPVLQSVYERHREGGLELIAISTQETSAEDVRTYVETYDLSYTIGFDASAAVFNAWQNFGLPTQYFIDRDGIIRAVVHGPLTEAEAELTIIPLLTQ